MKYLKLFEDIQGEFEIGDPVQWTISTTSGKVTMRGVVMDIDEGQDELEIVSHYKNNKMYTQKIKVNRELLSKGWES